jgi:hypothetical protein
MDQATLHGVWTIKTFPSAEDWISSILVFGSNQDGRVFITDLTSPAPATLAHVSGGGFNITLQTYSLGSYDPSNPNKGNWLNTPVDVSYGWDDATGLTITLDDGTGGTIALCTAENQPLTSPLAGKTPPDLTIPKSLIKLPIGGIGHPPKGDPDKHKDHDHHKDRDRDRHHRHDKD